MLDRKHLVLMLAMAGAPMLSVVAGTQEGAMQAGHQHPETSVNAADPPQMAGPSVQERRQAMRQRMLEIRTTQDPEKRRQLLEAQMKDLEALLEEGACPHPGGGLMAGQARQGMSGQGMMGRGMPPHGMGGGMQHGMGGKGMQGGMACGMGGGGMLHGMGGHGATATDEATIRRLEALEKRVDLLQRMLQMQAH